MNHLNMYGVESDRRRIGLELYRAETAIGVGRRAITELLTCEPVDETAVAVQRADVLEARLARNSLRHQLETAKQNEPPLPAMTW